MTSTAKKSSTKSSTKSSSSKPLSRKAKIQVSTFCLLALAGLCVSLPHLASEIGLLTGASDLSAWCLAITIDLGMTACKAYLASGKHTAQLTTEQKIAWGVVGTCTLWSMVLNSHAFCAHSSGTFGVIAAIGFGAFIPLFVLALSYLASSIISGQKK